MAVNGLESVRPTAEAYTTQVFVDVHTIRARGYSWLYQGLIRNPAVTPPVLPFLYGRCYILHI